MVYQIKDQNKILKKIWLALTGRTGCVNRESPKAVPDPVRGDANRLSFLRTQATLFQTSLIKDLHLPNASDVGFSHLFRNLLGAKDHTISAHKGPSPQTPFQSATKPAKPSLFGRLD